MGVHTVTDVMPPELELHGENMESASVYVLCAVEC